MFRMNNSGKLRLSKKTFIILVGSVLLVALIGWVVLLSGLLKNDKKPKDGTVTPTEAVAVPLALEYNLPEVPEGYVLVFRQTANYSVLDTGEKVLHQDFEYDGNGRLISDKTYNNDGSIYCESVYSYDETGNKTLVIYYDSEGTSREEETTYYANGVISEYRENHTKTLYDEQGRKLYSVNTDETGKETVIEECRYSSAGLLTEHLSGLIIGSNEFLHKELHFYDSLGNPTKTEYYYYGELSKEEVYLTPTLRETYFIEGTSRYLDEKCELDGKGRITHKWRYDVEDGSVESENLQEWDDDGNLVKVVTYNKGEFLYMTEYEYADKTAFYNSELRCTKAISEQEDGSVEYYVEREYMPGIGRIREQYFYADGKRMALEDYDGYWGYYSKKDSYGNPIIRVNCFGDREDLVEEFEFTPMAIPAAYMNDYDRRLAGE